ncbi:class I SAM-dependent methyltransferase [Lentzea sp. HUAS TT2]|uniref:class I SAM-dependent methyltransferase n=1 Tax=Lentzea sp. HUAS TT2 TaxID=3447454 RepID=UPI003F706B90
MAETSSQERDYLPGMGKHYLLPFYDVLHQVSGLSSIHREMVEVAGLSAGQRVLDVGCGTGNLLRSTGKRHRDVELFGVDPDLKMLARAEGKLRRAGVRARLDRGFAQELAFPDALFDVVFSSLMLHHLDGPSKGEMLAEVRRVLRPGGLLVLADIVRRGHPVKGIGEAGFAAEPTRTRKLRLFGEIGIEVARVH